MSSSSAPGDHDETSVSSTLNAALFRVRSGSSAQNCTESFGSNSSTYSSNNSSSQTSGWAKHGPQSLQARHDEQELGGLAVDAGTLPVADPPSPARDSLSSSNRPETNAEQLEAAFADQRESRLRDPLYLSVNLAEYQRFWTIIDADFYDYVTQKSSFEYDSDSCRLTIDDMNGERIPHARVNGYLCRVISGFVQRAVEHDATSELALNIHAVYGARTSNVGAGQRPAQDSAAVTGEVEGHSGQAGFPSESTNNSENHMRSNGNLRPKDKLLKSRRLGESVSPTRERVTSFLPDSSWAWGPNEHTSAATRTVVVEVANTEPVEHLVEKAHDYLSSPAMEVAFVIGVVLKCDGSISNLSDEYALEKDAAYMIVWRRGSQGVKLESITRLLRPDRSADELTRDIPLFSLAGFIPWTLADTLEERERRAIDEFGTAIVDGRKLAEEIRFAFQIEEAEGKQRHSEEMDEDRKASTLKQWEAWVTRQRH